MAVTNAELLAAIVAQPQAIADALAAVFAAHEAPVVQAPAKAEVASPFAVVPDAPEGGKLKALRAYHRAHKTPGQYCKPCDKGFAYPSKTGLCKSCGKAL